MTLRDKKESRYAPAFYIRAYLRFIKESFLSLGYPLLLAADFGILNECS